MNENKSTFFYCWVKLATESRIRLPGDWKYTSDAITVWRVSDHTVVRAIPLSYRKWQNSDPHNSETLQDIKMRFGIFDYVVEDNPQTNFGVAPPKGGGPTMGWNITFAGSFLFIFLFIFFFFYKPTGQTENHTYANNSSKHVVWSKEVPLGGLNDREPFLGKWGSKNPKIFPGDRDFPC